MVDILFFFDLVCIIKKFITKSFFSLLIESEFSDKYIKKKKFFFKRFLALTFKKKSESKVYVDVSVFFRFFSEFSYYGFFRFLELDRGSFSNFF